MLELAGARRCCASGCWPPRRGSCARRSSSTRCRRSPAARRGPLADREPGRVHPVRLGRKLRRGRQPAGRPRLALRDAPDPLEVPDLDLLRALNRGLVPAHYLAPNAVARRLRARLPQGGGVRRGADPQRARLLEVLRRDGLLARRVDELRQHRPRLRCRCEDGEGVLPDPGRHAARHVRRTGAAGRSSRASSTCSTWAWRAPSRGGTSPASGRGVRPGLRAFHPGDSRPPVVSRPAYACSSGGQRPGSRSTSSRGNGGGAERSIRASAGAAPALFLCTPSPLSSSGVC